MARPEIKGLYALTNIPHISRVYMIFRAELTQPEFGAPSLDVALFSQTRFLE